MAELTAFRREARTIAIAWIANVRLSSLRIVRASRMAVSAASRAAGRSPRAAA
jgi:hypothetical protein